MQDHIEEESSKILAIYRDGKFIHELNAGEKGSILLDRTPFYAESGGQIGDQGLLSIPNTAYFKVLDTIKHGHAHLHLGKLEKGKLKVGDKIHPQVDAKRRAATVLNHTATHLLHLVLRKVIGEHALQKGSLVEPSRLRFDFAHTKPLTEDEIKEIEYQVNAHIRANYPAKVDISTPDEAFQKGAIGLFGEKYGNKVRVVHFGPSVELCGGTHADHTGDIGLFKITNETGIAAGIRRIEALTGDEALKYTDQEVQLAKQKVSQSEIRMLALEKEIQHLKDKLALLSSKELAAQAKTVGHVKMLATVVSDIEGKSLRHTVDHLKRALGSAVIVLASVKEKKVSVVIGVTENLLNVFNAKDIVNHIAPMIGGKGGGRAELAEAGGNQPEALKEALAWVYQYVAEKIHQSGK